MKKKIPGKVGNFTRKSWKFFVKAFQRVSSRQFGTPTYYNVSARIQNKRFFHGVIHEPPNDANGITKSEDPYQTDLSQRSSQVQVCNVCPNLYVQKFWICVVVHMYLPFFMTERV